ncbi:MAG TPA: EamA family transporter, partial [Burkholderiaceae bacterium]
AGLLGGAGGIGSYGIVLWAMTRAPIAEVAALRETAILFGALIAMFWLRERMRRRGFIAIALIVAGAMVFRLA